MEKNINTPTGNPPLIVRISRKRSHESSPPVDKITSSQSQQSVSTRNNLPIRPDNTRAEQTFPRSTLAELLGITQSGSGITNTAQVSLQNKKISIRDKKNSSRGESFVTSPQRSLITAQTPPMARLSLSSPQSSSSPHLGESNTIVPIRMSSSMDVMNSASGQGVDLPPRSIEDLTIEYADRYVEIFEAENEQNFKTHTRTLNYYFENKLYEKGISYIGFRAKIKEKLRNKQYRFEEPTGYYQLARCFLQAKEKAPNYLPMHLLRLVHSAGASHRRSFTNAIKKARSGPVIICPEDAKRIYEALLKMGRNILPHQFLVYHKLHNTSGYSETLFDAIYAQYQQNFKQASFEEIAENYLDYAVRTYVKINSKSLIDYLKENHFIHLIRSKEDCSRLLAHIKEKGMPLKESLNLQRTATASSQCRTSTISSVETSEKEVIEVDLTLSPEKEEPHTPIIILDPKEFERKLSENPEDPSFSDFSETLIVEVVESSEENIGTSEEEYNEDEDEGFDGLHFSSTLAQSAQNIEQLHSLSEAMQGLVDPLLNSFVEQCLRKQRNNPHVSDNDFYLRNHVWAYEIKQDMFQSALEATRAFLDVFPETEVLSKTPERSSFAASPTRTPTIISTPDPTPDFIDLSISLPLPVGERPSGEEISIDSRVQFELPFAYDGEEVGPIDDNLDESADSSLQAPIANTSPSYDLGGPVNLTRHSRDPRAHMPVAYISKEPVDLSKRPEH